MYVNLNTSYGNKAIQEECFFVGFHTTTIMVCFSAMGCGATFHCTKALSADTFILQ
jgi:hypothetical protein